MEEQEPLDVLRRERKYRISIYDVSRLESRLRLIMQEDPHNGRRGYKVRSLYFDTWNNGDFYDKTAGVEERKKIRLRIYDPDDAFAKLEIKEKRNLYQRKRSLILSRPEAEQVADGQYECLLEKGKFGMELYGAMVSSVYRPVGIVEYERLAFLADSNDIRVTLDQRIRVFEGNRNIFARDFSGCPADMETDAVLEVKYNHFLFSYISDVLDSIDKTEDSYSKYCKSRKYGLGGEI